MPADWRDIGKKQNWGDVIGESAVMGPSIFWLILCDQQFLIDAEFFHPRPKGGGVYLQQFGGAAFSVQFPVAARECGNNMVFFLLSHGFHLGLAALRQHVYGSHRQVARCGKWARRYQDAASP